MQLETIHERVGCTETQIRILIYDPSVIQSILLQNLGANTVEIGPQGVTYGTGYPLEDGSTLSITWQDFAPAVRDRGPSMVEIWGICGAGLTASIQVYGIARR
jgi:hypothetical protein